MALGFGARFEVLGNAVLNSVSAIPLDTFVAAVATLLAAFFGAFAAFKLEDRIRRNREIRDNIGAGNRALFTLIRFWNDLAVIRKQIMEPFRNHPGRAVAMPPTQNLEEGRLTLNLGELSFLIARREGTLLNQLLVEEDRYRSLIASLNERARIHFGTAQPALARAGIEEGRDYVLDDIRAALGDPLFYTLDRLTTEIVDHTDCTIRSIEESIDELRLALKRIYPNGVFITFEPGRHVT